MKLKRRDFMKISAGAGVAGLLAPSLVNARSSSVFPAARKPLSSFDPQVRDIISKMTLEEKVGQMVQADQENLEDVQDIAKYYMGSVLSGGNSDPKAGNSLAAWADMYDGYQRIAIKTRLGIPILYGVDAVHGHNNVLGAVVFPHNIGLGCTRNARLVEDAARVTAEEVRATGTQWVFAPCVTVPRDERWGRTYEGFGEAPELAKVLGVPNGAAPALVVQARARPAPEPVRELPLYGGAPAALPQRYTDLVLKSISGTKSRRFALLNNQTIGVGESARVQLGDSEVKVRCLEVRERSVVVAVEGQEGSREVFLRE